MSESDGKIARGSRPSSLKYSKQTAQSKLVSSPVPDLTVDTPPSIRSEANAADQESMVQSQSVPRSALDTPTKTSHLKTNSPLPSRLRQNLSTASIDSGLQSGTSSRTSLVPSCRTSQEVNASNLIQSSSTPVLTDLDNNSKPSPPSPEHENILSSKPPPLITCPPDSNSSFTRRYSVDGDVLAELMKAALRLETDAQPLTHNRLDVKDGPYTERRRSTGDYFRLMKEERGERNRRLSSQAYFHSLVNLPKSPTQRKSSGCIVCDRKQKNSSSSSSASTVIIKTTMSRKSLQRRRFSEALQVMSRSQSNIPYVELYVMKVEDLRKLQEEYNFSVQKPSQIQKLTSIEETREEMIKECVTTHLPDFFRYTNWTTILCHLVSKRLLSDDDRQRLCSLATNTEKGNFFYLDVLPTKGDDAYCRFYHCVNNEQEHSGHTELIQKLNRTLRDM